MRNSARQSKTIRFYLYLWGAFILGVLIVLPLSETKSNLRWIAFAGFILCAGSLVLNVMWLPQVQRAIKSRYFSAPKDEKRFLWFLFYFSRGVFLFLGILITVWGYFGEDIATLEFTEIQGEIAYIHLSDQNLKIEFVDNSNSYGITNFKVPDESLKQIEDELHPGETLYILINAADEKLIDDPNIQIYGIRTDSHEYLSPQEYQREITSNNRLGFVLGLLFIGFGFIYMITGNIHKI